MTKYPSSMRTPPFLRPLVRRTDAQLLKGLVASGGIHEGTGGDAGSEAAAGAVVDLLLCCVDNDDARLAVADACMEIGVPFIDADTSALAACVTCDESVRLGVRARRGRALRDDGRERHGITSPGKRSLTERGALDGVGFFAGSHDARFTPAQGHATRRSGADRMPPLFANQWGYQDGPPSA